MTTPSASTRGSLHRTPQSEPIIGRNSLRDHPPPAKKRKKGGGKKGSKRNARSRSIVFHVCKKFRDANPQFKSQKAFLRQEEGWSEKDAMVFSRALRQYDDGRLQDVDQKRIRKRAEDKETMNSHVMGIEEDPDMIEYAMEEVIGTAKRVVGEKCEGEEHEDDSDPTGADDEQPSPDLDAETDMRHVRAYSV